MIDWVQKLILRLASEPALVRIVVSTVRGSAPREAGACMLVGATRVDGSIGGGNLEWQATLAARAMLDQPDAGYAHTQRFSLGATLGQCCGGAVELRFERYARADRAALERRLRENPPPAMPALWLYGAGHVGRALVPMLGELAFEVTWVDGREDIFPAQLPGNVRALDAGTAPPGAFHLVMTHSHDLDYDIVRTALRHGDFAWLGMIGSDTKARRFRQRLAQQGYAPERIARLVSPIGVGGIKSKLPGAIAVAAAAQLQQVLEARAAACPSVPWAASFPST